MSVRQFAQRINANALLSMQKYQYSERLVLAVNVPAGQTQLGRCQVSSYGHFFCQWWTGHFETIRNVAGVGTIDDAVNHCRGLLIDSTGNRRLFNDYIPLDLLFSPGRRRSNTALNVIQPVGAIAVAVAPYPLFYPTEFEYVFSANTEIQLDVRNDSDVAIAVEMCFHGIRLVSSAVTPQG